MLFSRKTHLVGLDIGSRTMKVGEIAESKKSSRLKKFGMIDIAPGVIEDGVIKDPDAAAESIRQLFKSFGVKEQNVAVSVGGYSVIVKKINVETMPEERLQDTIHFEAEQYIPFDISDVNLDFHIIGESENNPNQMSVFLVAAKKEMVEAYIDLTAMAGLNACIVDVEAFALQNSFEASYDIPEENIALIDIGASKTSLNILKQGQSVFMRDVSLGCGQINQSIMSLVNCSFEEAEQLKFGEQTEKISRKDLAQILSSVVTGWCTEIRRALEFFYSTYPEDQINRIVLGGGGANIMEFRQLLAAETSANVEIINPFLKLQADSNFDSSYLKQIAPQAAICMGLAARRVDDK
jgi:type IV pilus assembly protein PilM